jgi:uncharacterized membrane protein YfbV (UPF0208 family)
MKAERWTARQVTLDAEATLAAERRLIAERHAAKLRNIVAAVAVIGLLATIGALFVGVVTGAIVAAMAVIGVLISGYFWTGARSRVALADVARSTVQSEQKNWKKQKPRDMVE